MKTTRLQAYVFGLVVACPETQGQNDACFLHQFRKYKTTKEKLEFVISLTNDELVEIVDKHRTCKCINCN